MHSAQSVPHIFLSSILSSYAVYYHYPSIPSIWRPFISPHLFLPPSPRFPRSALSEHLSSPPLNQAPPRLSYPQSFLSFLTILTNLLWASFVLGCTEQIRNNTAAAVVAGSWQETVMSLLWDVYIYKHKRTFTQTQKRKRSLSHCYNVITKYACTLMHKVRLTHREAQCIKAILQYLMFLCDPCPLTAHASAVDLWTFAALFCLVVIWEQAYRHTHAHSRTHTHTHRHTSTHTHTCSPCLINFYNYYDRNCTGRWSEGSGWIQICIVQTLTCICFVCTALVTVATVF